ncbi:MAG: cyclase [Lentisphaeria bacterium]|jgi:cyclase
MNIKKAAIYGAFLFTSFSAFADDNAALSFASTKVGPGLYMLSGVGGFTGGNIGLSIGEDGVVMIDDSMPPMLDIMKTAISSITDKPVDFLINTHIHGDHIGNNQAISEAGARIVAHENLRLRMLDKGIQTDKGMTPAPKGTLPVITFSQSIDFHLNGEDAHIFHAAKAHTDGDAVIVFKNANVIHAGDTLFNGLFPFIDFDNGGSVEGYIAAQKTLLSISNNTTKIIPGHGPLATRGDIEKSLAMLEKSKTLVESLIKKGKSEDEIVALNPLAEFHDSWNWGFITTEKMTRQLAKGLQ